MRPLRLVRRLAEVSALHPAFESTDSTRFEQAFSPSQPVVRFRTFRESLHHTKHWQHEHVPRACF